MENSLTNAEKLSQKDEDPTSQTGQTHFVLMLSPMFISLGMIVMSPVFLNVTPGYECRQDSPDFFNLVCESSWKRPFIISMFMTGMMVGSMFGGQLSDRFGRKKTSLSTFALHIIFEAILSFSFSYWFYVLFIFLLGIVDILAYLCTYIWAQEIVRNSSEKRSFAAFCVSAMYGVGSMSVSLVAYVLPDWNWIYGCLAIISLGFFPFLWCVPESAMWLKQQSRSTSNGSKLVRESNDKDEANLDKKNVDTSLDESSESNLAKPSYHEENSASLLFRNRILLRRILSACFLWNIGFLGYYTMALNSSNLGGSVYVNNLIGGALDVVAAALMMGLLKKFSRRNTLASLYAVFALFAITSPPVKKSNEVAGLIFAMSGRFFATTCMLLTVLYTAEIFPTLLRNTSVGITSMSARVASILSPFLIFAGEEMDLSIPFYVMGGVSCVGVYITLLLPETSKSLLPNTVGEAIALEKHRIKLTSCKRKNKI